MTLYLLQTMKQCVICGDFHESNIKGFMCDAHMCTMPNSNDYVCEWCFCYSCLKCGNPFRDDPTRAVPGKWLQRFQCLSCSQQQIAGDVHASIVKVNFTIYACFLALCHGVYVPAIDDKYI